MTADRLRDFARTHRARLLTLGAWTFWIMLALAIRTFLFQPFNIPSRSMEPVLLVGDHLFVSKYAYGYSRYALPFQSGDVSVRLFASTPERGDVVVFRPVKDDSRDYIKRVIGIAGDSVQVKNGELYLNGEYIKRVFLRNHVWREFLPQGRDHLILDIRPQGVGDNTPLYHVPEGYIFVMGDNRDNSMDSRFMSQIGFVPITHLIGRAEMIYFSIDWAHGWDIRWRRIGSWIE